MTIRREVDCCIAGGGPAGMFAGLLFARAGLKTLVLEKHGDFLRDFRGDTVHPSTMENLHELGLLDRFLERPHDRMAQISVRFAGRRIRAADLSALPTRARFIAFMPQWEFLDFLADEARRHDNFELMMDTEALALVETGGVVTGLTAQGPGGPVEVAGRLVIGADGRGSRLREQAGLAVRDVGAPIDVLWFSVPKHGEQPNTLLNASPGHLVVTIDRGAFWQCAFVIPKGGLDRLRQAGLETLRGAAAAAAPQVEAGLDTLKDWDQVKLLNVRVDRLERWSRPGLVMIGDAAHAMSPIGGVGINLAIQDAVAAANLLAPKLAKGPLTGDDLDAVRRRREWPTRATQFVQVQVQNRLLAPLLRGTLDAGARPPLPLRLADRFGFVRRLAARGIGLGARPEHISPDIGSGPATT